MCPGTLLVGTLKDQTDREELFDVGGTCVCTFAKISFPSFGIVFVFVFVLCPGSVHVPWWDSTPELTLWCGDVVWCDVVWCGVMCLQGRRLNPE
jgi:hypothetical protein